jgi:hypothetical protein
MKNFTLIAGLFLSLAVAVSTAQARQYSNGRGQVVHTRRAPVVMHRAVPPFRGVHVYQK